MASGYAVYTRDYSLFFNRLPIASFPPCPRKPASLYLFSLHGPRGSRGGNRSHRSTPDTRILPSVCLSVFFSLWFCFSLVFWALLLFLFVCSLVGWLVVFFCVRAGVVEPFPMLFSRVSNGTSFVRRGRLIRGRKYSFTNACFARFSLDLEITRNEPSVAIEHPPRVQYASIVRFSASPKCVNFSSCNERYKSRSFEFTVRSRTKHSSFASGLRLNVV